MSFYRHAVVITPSAFPTTYGLFVYRLLHGLCKPDRGVRFPYGPRIKTLERRLRPGARTALVVETYLATSC